MSTYPPPSNQPYPDVLPPPPPPRSSGGDGCWKWGAIGCGMGCLSLAIIFAAGMFIVMPQVRPLMSECMKIQAEVSMVQHEMRTLLSALQRYRDVNGKYPPNLEALVPNYLPDRSALRFSQAPQGPAFKYTVPRGDTADQFPVLEYALTSKAPDNRPIPVPIRVAPTGEFNKDAVPEQCRAFLRNTLDQ